VQWLCDAVHIGKFEFEPGEVEVHDAVQFGRQCNGVVTPYRRVYLICRKKVGMSRDVT
jgi:hypothetical protein